MIFWYFSEASVKSKILGIYILSKQNYPILTIALIYFLRLLESMDAKVILKHFV